MKLITCFSFFLLLFSVNTFAQENSYMRLEGHTHGVSSVSFSPDGATLASGSADRTVRLWNANTGEHLQTLTGHTDRVYDVLFSPDGNTLASGSRDGTIRVWDAATGKHIRTLTGHTHGVNSVSFSPDGATLASGSADRTVRLWNANTGEHLQTLTGYTGSVNSVSFSPDGATLASGSGDFTVRLWDANTGEHLQTLGERNVIHSVSFSPDGATLASGSAFDTVRLWDANTGEHLQTLTGHRNIVHSVSFSPDGATLASGSRDGTVRFWDVNTGEHLQTLTGHTHMVSSVSFSPDGQVLASGSWDRTVRLWDLPDTRIYITPTPVMSPAVGEQFTISVSIADGENVGGYQVSLVFDPTVLRYVESADGDYLPSGAFFVPPVVSRNKITLGATALAGGSNGNGTLARITFEVVDVKRSSMGLSEVILTDNDGAHLFHLAHSGWVEPSVLSVSSVIRLTPASVLSPATGERLTFNVNIAGGQNVADYQLTYNFDASALKYISASRGNYLAGGVGNGDGTLETISFEVLDVKASAVSVSGHLIAPNGLRYLPTFERTEVIVPLFGDVNRDGNVNILDLVQVASSFGQPVPEEGNPADVNEDGVVNIVDLVKVAGALGGDAAAPSAWSLDLEDTFTREQVQQWLSEARQFNLTDATGQRGILYLEQFLAPLTLKETALLPNYPNPFNPETWIPYQLSEAADVSIAIYAVNGKLVRMLDLGYQSVGYYDSRSRAAYWDGRNALGELVASGVYFYTLTAGDFTATRRMLILK